MLTLKDIIAYQKLRASLGDPMVPVPRDHLPAGYYTEARAREACIREERNTNEEDKYFGWIPEEQRFGYFTKKQG